MDLSLLNFKRRFSVNSHGDLRIKCGEMSCFKDFVNDGRGDPYPLIADGVTASAAVKETVGGGRYSLSASLDGCKRRLLGGFFPWHVYEIDFRALRLGSVGLSVDSVAGRVDVSLGSDGAVRVSADGECRSFSVDSLHIADSQTLTVAFRQDALTVYIGRYGRHVQRVCDVESKTLAKMRSEDILATAHAYLQCELKAGGSVTLERIEWFLTAGLSQADMRPVKYENGEVMVRDGRIFLTVSARLEAGGYQVVLSLTPSLCDFRLEGAIFFNCGDGVISGDVASSIVYDRDRDVWLHWVCMFSHGHYLARCESKSCSLFGINVMAVDLIEKGDEDEDRTAFKGFEGDEDPDLIKIDGKWHLSVCRLSEDVYKYYHFVSDGPLDGFKFVDRTPRGEKTGGSFVLCHDGEIRFVCGSEFGKRALYEDCPVGDFSACKPLKCDFDDGGFRGWGTVMLLPYGNRKRYTWITFDRHNVTEYNWSYGNIYVFDSECF